MYENFLNDKCPICGGAIGYHINSYGALVKKCTACGNIIGNNIITTNKTTITDYNSFSTNTKGIKDYVK